MSMKKTGAAERITSVLDPKEEEAKRFREGKQEKISKEAFKKGEPEVTAKPKKS